MKLIVTKLLLNFLFHSKPQLFTLYVTILFYVKSSEK